MAKIKSINQQLQKKAWDINFITNGWQTYQYEMGLSEIKVAILDSGIDVRHPGLQNVVDSYHSLIDLEPMEDFTGHGTMIAGQIAGNGYIKGIAPGVRVCSYKILDENNQTKITHLIDSIRMAIKDNVNIINMSLGFYLDEDYISSELIELEKLISELNEKNIICVSSPGYGEEKKIHYPSNFDTVISCQSLSRELKKINNNIFSNYCLPSGDYRIETLVEKGLSEYVPIYFPINLSHKVHSSLNMPLGYSYMIGESLSAAKLTGIIAVIQSFYLRRFGENISRSSLIQLLDEYSDEIEGSKMPSLLRILKHMNTTIYK